MRNTFLFTFSLFLFTFPALAKGLLDVPVAAVTNKAYLTGMRDRPWWNKAWQRRAPILVSNVSDVRVSRATIDFVLDVGEEIDPASVRVVTPWETEVECVAERVRRTDTPVRSNKDGLSSSLNGQECPFSEGSNGQECPFSGAVRLIFETSLRERENRPFLVYWNRRTDTPVRSREETAGTDKSVRSPEQTATRVRSPMTVQMGEKEVYLSNGAVEVVFDNQGATPGVLKTLRAAGSSAPSELQWRTTEYALDGFTFKVGNKTAPWSKARLTTDTPLCKTVTFTNELAELDFTLYAGQPRVDYAYRLKAGETRASVDVAWACGGGGAYDDFHYVGLAGKLLSFPAALDHVTDNESQPEYWGFPWMSRGWYAIRDRKAGDVVGMVFDRASFAGMQYVATVQSSGQRAGISFEHRPPKGERAVGKGALVAAVGPVKIVEETQALLANPPQVFVSDVETVREIPVKVPHLAHDFCVNCNVGFWRTSTPLPTDDWAANTLAHIRALGANTILLGQITDYNWGSLPVSKDLYDRTCAYMKRLNPNRKLPDFTPENFDPSRLKKMTGEAHRQGLAVCTWHQGMPGLRDGDKYNAEDHAFCREFQVLYPKCGVDSTFNALGGGEWVGVPDELRKQYGSKYWAWKGDPQPFFDARRKYAEEMKRFYDVAHKENPDTTVMVFNTDNGSCEMEMFMSYYPKAMDSLLCQFMSGGDLSTVKHAAKRLRGYFDNEAARTIHQHYYFMKLDHAQRISQCELPFICGVNGFSQESMTYENFDREFFELTADFNRFALYTKLGEKVAKMAPVKNVAVLRDMDCFEEDCRKHRTVGYDWWSESLHDARGKSFAHISSYNYDVVLKPYFTADSLKRYKVVYIPEDDVLSEELAKEALAFVEQGGGLVVEGETGEKSKLKVEVEERRTDTLRRTDTPVRSEQESNNSILRLRLGTSTLSLSDGLVTPYGKGKIVWTKTVLTDGVRKRDASAIRRVKELIASVGGKDPFSISKANGQECPFSGLDGVLQSSDEGMFLGVYNRSKKAEIGRVTIGERTLLSVLGDARTDKSVRSPLFVLDVKNGVRFPYTNGFEIAVGPEQCGFYLIGDDAYTALPAARRCAWTGAAASSRFAPAKKPAAQKTASDDFAPKTCIEFVSAGGANFRGDPSFIRRSHAAGLVRKSFVANEAQLVSRYKIDDVDAWRDAHRNLRPFTPAGFAKALETASYVHFKAPKEDTDAAFAECAPALTAFLKRGGGFLFDNNAPGPAARKFLAEAGVYDPYESLKGGVGDRGVVFDETMPTNHSFLTCHPVVEGWKGSNYVVPFARDGGEYSQCFTKWDAAKQFAPFRAARDTTAAELVIQENVLGAGKVVFSQNVRAFSDWYETKTYGDTILSWFIGMSVSDHAEKTLRYNGGPGEVVRRN